MNPPCVDQPLDDEAAFSDEQAVLLEPRRIADVAIGLAGAGRPLG